MKLDFSETPKTGFLATRPNIMQKVPHSYDLHVRIQRGSGPLEKYWYITDNNQLPLELVRDRTGNAPGTHQECWRTASFCFFECLDWLRLNQTNEQIFIIIFFIFFTFQHTFRIILICLKLHLFKFRGLKLDNRDYHVLINRPNTKRLSS